MSEPSPETEAAAWKAVEKAADSLYKFYKYSKKIEAHLKTLLPTFIGDNVEQTIKDNEANVIALAKIFQFAFRFDEKKMVKPSIQNDFSYYRRVVGKMRAGKQSATNNKKKIKTKVGEDDANKMSFHFAFPTPVMKVLIDSTVLSNENNQQYIASFSTIANVACNMVENDDLSDDDKMLLLCVMTGCIILVDHLIEGGAFQKRSPIRIVQCLTLLRNYQSQNTDFLLNSIRLSSTNLSHSQNVNPTVKRILLE